MNKNSKRITWMGLVMGLALMTGLAGCTQATPTAGPTPTPRGATLDGQEGNAIITFATDEWSRAMYEPLAEEFNALHPDITVQMAIIPDYNPVDETEQYNYVRALATTGDTAMLWGGYTMAMGASNYFRDLGPLIDSDPAFEADDFWPGILSSCEDAEGRVIGIPISGYFSGLYYDEAAFDAAGVPKPVPGWTWEDFQRAVTGLARSEGGTQHYGFADRNYFSGSALAPVVDAYLYNSGGEIDADEIEEQVKWYIDLAKAKALYPIIDQSNANEDVWQEWQNLFTGDNPPAMWIGGLVEPMPGSMGRYFEGDDPWKDMAISKQGFVPFPVGEGNDGNKTTPVTTQCLGISAGSSNPRAAWAWVDFLSRKWLVRDQSQVWELQQVPARQSVAEEVGYFEMLPAKAKETVQFGMSNAWFGSLYPNTLEMVGQAIAAHIAGNKDLDTAIADVQVSIASIPEPTPDTTPVVLSTPVPPPPPGATVINFFTNRFGPNPEDPIKILAQSYMETHPDIFIKIAYDFQGRPDEDYLAGLASAFDCFAWYEPYFQEDQSPVGLLSLNSLFQAEGNAFTEDFNPSQLDSFRYAGELLGLPVSSQTSIMSYNADILAKRGLQPPDNDWTFEDFIDLMEAASSNSGTDKSYGFLADGWDDLLLEGRGAKWGDLESDPPKANFDSPEMIAALNWMADMVDSGALLVQKDDNWEQINNAFRDGQVAFWISQAGEPWGYYMPYGETPKYKIGVAPMPEMPSTSNYGGWANTMGLFISENTQNPQICWDFIKYVSEQPNSLPGIPARRSVNESAAWEAQVGPDFAEVYRAALSRIKPRSEMIQTTYSPISWPFYQWKSETVREVINGEQPRGLLEEAQLKADDYLACMADVDISKMTDEQVQEEVRNCAKTADPEGMW